MSDRPDGIYQKYKVERTDGSSSGPLGRHRDCTYFVLDLEHDEYAIPALKAYARACRARRPELSADIDTIVANRPVRCGCREAMCPHAPVFSPDGHSEMAGHLMAVNERNAKAKP